jgi:flavin reductase (DIM6/NTAB) family NADH-FMN oxidoreductase RutF
VIREILPAVANSLPVRAAFNSVPTAVAALCAMVDGEPRGLVATSLSVGVSYDPPMVSFSVLNSSTTWPVLRGAARIGVSVLSDAQGTTCMQIASKTGNRFAGLETVTSPDDALFVHGATSWLDCSIEAEVGAGDHHLVVLRVHGVSTVDDEEPLVFHRADFRRLGVGPRSRGER